MRRSIVISLSANTDNIDTISGAGVNAAVNQGNASTSQNNR